MRAWFAALAGLALAAQGCVVARRFDGATQAALGRTEMNVLETDLLRVYYPAHSKGEALRIATRVEGCVVRLRKMVQVHGELADRKVTLIVPDVPLNNAYVIPPLAGEPVSVVPTHNTGDVFALFGLPPDPGFIGCHEVVHWLHGTQISGFPAFVDRVFGDAYTPQIGLDTWFWEGLAVYFETRLQGGGGRLGSRYWDGVFAAGVAARGVIGGDLSEHNRQTPFGSHYLIGSYFVDWLARTYGEANLWSVVKSQSNALLFPFGVNLRFNGVYDKTLSTLIEEFDGDLKKRWPKRPKPATQTMVRELGTESRYERGPDGSEAIVDASQDQPTRLRVFDRSGKLVLERNLVDVLPPRKLIVASPLTVSGLSFSPDGRALYFVALDQGEFQPTSRLLRVDLATGKLTQIVPELRGPGGSLAPDGRTYVFSLAQGDRYSLAAIDVVTKKFRVLADVPARTYVLDAQVSPDGRRVLATVHDGNEFHLEVFDFGAGGVASAAASASAAVTSTRTVVAGPDGPRVEGRWVDDARITFAGLDDGRLQVFVSNAKGYARKKLSDAPFLAYRPRPHDGRVRFLDRAGWRWTLDEIPLPPAEPETAGSEQEPPPPPEDYPPPPPTLDAAPSSYAKQWAEPALEKPISIHADEPYSHLDGLFRPQVRGPSLSIGTRTATAYGLGAIGGDRLGYHRWGIEALYSPEGKLVSGSATYLHQTLAPWYWSMSGSHLALRTGVLRDDGTFAASGTRRETNAGFDVLRELFGNFLRARLAYIGLERSLDTGQSQSLRFIGPTLQALWIAAESTPYAGLRRALILDAQASYYPEGANAARWPLADFRGTISGALPLPLSKRHTLRMFTRARALEGAEPELLQVGGTGGMLGRSSQLDAPDGDPRDLLPPQMVFAEAVRGFEDVGLFARRVGIGELAYRYPLIVDWGSASSLWVLPAFFLRQLDLELFGTAATLFDDRTPLTAIGSALTMRIAFFRVPLAIRGQVARRLTFDPRFNAFVTIGAEL